MGHRKKRTLKKSSKKAWIFGGLVIVAFIGLWIFGIFSINISEIENIRQIIFNTFSGIGTFIMTCQQFVSDFQKSSEYMSQVMEKSQQSQQQLNVLLQQNSENSYTNPISPISGSDNTPASESNIENQIFQLTNNERKNNGVNPLVYDSSLAAIARAHSQDMLNNNFFSHINLNGDDPSERASKAGYNIHKSYQVGVAENIGMTEGYVSSSSVAQEFIDMWMNSPGHRSNILNSQYNRLGVGVASKGSKIISTQVFF
jgi:uncharacterized protein YkwD